MKLEQFLERRWTAPAPKRHGRSGPGSLSPTSTMSSLAEEVSPLEFSKCWLWKEWSFTGSDPKAHGYVYVMCKSPRIHKIGTSNDPIRRVAELTSFNKTRIWLAGMWVHPSYGMVEQLAHKLLAGHESNFGKEWFKVSRDVAFATVVRAMAEISKRDEAQARYQRAQAQAERNRKRRKSDVTA